QQLDLRAADSQGIGEDFDQRGVGLAVLRRRSHGDLERPALLADDPRPAGPRLSPDWQDQTLCMIDQLNHTLTWPRRPCPPQAVAGPPLTRAADQSRSGAGTAQRPRDSSGVVRI